MTNTTPSPGSKLPTILGVAALLFLAFAFGLRLVWFGAEKPLPELLQSLPDSKTDADQEVFLERLRKAFPIGASDADVAATLRGQGFKITGAERIATYDRAAGLNDKCRRSGNVRWTADTEGRVTDVAGGYYKHCPAR